MSTIGFVINPVAGMGGRVGLKGTDGVAEEAARRGARPLANSRARQALRALRQLLGGRGPGAGVAWLTASGAMGEDALRAEDFDAIRVVHHASGHPTAHDTQRTAEAFVAAGVDLILFCGGDGTARDICAVTGERVPILGIPAGVKMYSGVFGVTPERTAEILRRYLCQEIGLAAAEIVDLDEDRYRQGEWAVRLHMTARTPSEPSYMQASKAIIEGAEEETVKGDIAEHVREEIEAHPDTLFLLGPGSTLQALAAAFHGDKTLLGIDALAHGRIVARDLAEQQIDQLLDRYPERRLVLSPIGAQGFVLGRGNQPLSPAVLRRIGLDNVMVVATPAKLARTPVLRFDTGDAALDADMISRKFLPVIAGYHRIRFVKLAG